MNYYIYKRQKEMYYWQLHNIKKNDLLWNELRQWISVTFCWLHQRRSHICRHKYFSRGWRAWQEICNLQLLFFINGDYPATLPIPVWPRQKVKSAAGHICFHYNIHQHAAWKILFTLHIKLEIYSLHNSV